MFFVRQKVWLTVLVRRVFAFLFSFQLITFSLFLLGNLQEFLDSTQLFLLQAQRIAGIIFIFVGIYSFAGQIIDGIQARKFHFLRFIMTLVAYILGLVMIGIVFFFLTWMETG